MKILATTIEKIFNPFILLGLNLAIIILAELAGGGVYFAKTGLSYMIAVLFVGLIMVRILSDYAFGDFILKGFLKIQLTFLLLLGLFQMYEFIALNVLMIRQDVVHLTVMAGYFVWILSLFLSLGYVLRIYYKMPNTVMVVLWGFFLICVAGLIAPNVSPAVVAWFPPWFPKLILTGMVIAGGLGIFATKKLTNIMPVFLEYARYAIPATVLLVLTGFSKFFEAYGGVPLLGISPVQNILISHFLVYAALSLFLIGFGKLKRPQGIYADM